MQLNAVPVSVCVCVCVCGGRGSALRTDPNVDEVGRSCGGVEQQVGVADVEGAVQGLGNLFQVQVLDAPHLEPWLLPSCCELLMGNHDVSEEGGGGNMRVMLLLMLFRGARHIEINAKQRSF